MPNVWQSGTGLKPGNSSSFPSCLSPLFQSKSQWKAFHVKSSFITCKWTQLLVWIKGPAPGLVLKKKGVGEWGGMGYSNECSATTSLPQGKVRWVVIDSQAICLSICLSASLLVCVLSHDIKINLKGSSQPLPCFCLHLEMWLTKLLKISTKKYLG